MTTPSPDALRLIDGYSLEMTGKDIEALKTAAPAIPAGSRINVTFLGNEDLGMRLEAVSAVKQLGFTPVPHISSRRLKSTEQLREYLGRLQELEASEHVFVVGGDPAEPEGPYSDSLEVIRSGLLPEFGVREVSIAGYPEGHPDIATDVLWQALEDKTASLAEQQLGAVVLTQFAFDADAVVTWVKDVRARGIGAELRIGTPGPAGIKRLLGFARRFGIGANTMIVKKYGFSLTNLLGTAGPDRFVGDLAEQLAGEPTAGSVKLHMYTFGGLAATADWAAGYTAQAAS